MMDEEILDIATLTSARTSLDWDADDNVERLAACLVILMRGFLDKLIKEQGR